MTDLLDVQLPPQLSQLSSLLEDQPQSFAPGSRDIRQAALTATQFVFDLALQSETSSQPHIADLLASFQPSQAPQTRSQTRANGKRKRSPSPSSTRTLERTPLSALFVDGMNDDQIWAQLELRTDNVWDMLKVALEGTDEPPLEGEEEGEEKTHVTLDRIKKRENTLDEEDDSMDVDNDAAMDMYGLSMEEEDEEDDDSSEEEDEGDDDSEEEENLGESVTELRDPSSDEDDEEEAGTHSNFSLPRKKPPQGKPGGHPELDDGFFDLAAFNAETEEAEARSVSRGELGHDSDDSDDDEGIDFYADVQPDGDFEIEDETGDASYKDFFEPPSRSKLKIPKASPFPAAPSPAPRAGKVRFNDEVRVKSIKARGKNLPLSVLGGVDENEDEDEDEDYAEESVDDTDMVGMYEEDVEEDEGASEDDGAEDGFSRFDDDEVSEGDLELGGRNAMARLQNDLFADDEEEGDGLSTFEKRQAAIREQITELEKQNIAKKDWTLMGEATSRSRPANSLLEEDLEFERVMKAVPVITEEYVQGLEDRIKARILEGNFDDVVRRRAVDDKPFLPSRFFELQDTKSKQSLAQIYEDEYTAAQTGGVSGEDRDGKLKKEHEEVEKIWEGISWKLDALSNAHFTPKAPKATISTISNVASASLESALPTSKSAATMLAPEEIFRPSLADTRVRNELTPAEKKALHHKQKKAKKKARDALETGVDKYAKLKGIKGVKAQKEAALQSVVKSGKGVTVVGKKSKDLKKERTKS
ncbi:U3 small nucleolar ribonucleoprotein complex, subunit Mpp10 [Amylostereum chailletii]|nr:U3 small nucleolar ribonucleoprotein complex, subunit Mpp10 [Amylostereum chailletii]